MISAGVVPSPGREDWTNVPRPTWRVTAPPRSSSSSQRRTADRLSPSRDASSRSAGSRPVSLACAAGLTITRPSE